MVEIKPDEISAILRQQLSNFNAGADLEEVGTVLQVGDGIARIYGVLVVPNYPVTIIVLWIVQYGVSTLYTCTHTLLFIVHPG